MANKKVTKPKGARLIKPLSAAEDKLLDVMYNLILTADTDSAPDARASLAHKYAVLIAELFSTKPEHFQKLIDTCRTDLRKCIADNAPTEGDKEEFITMCKEAKEGMEYKLGILEAFVKNRDKIIQYF